MLLADGVSVPRTHDLAFLHEHAVRAEVEVPFALVDAEALYPYAVEFRYDGLVTVPEPSADHLLQVAQTVVEWAERVVAGTDLPA